MSRATNGGKERAPARRRFFSLRSVPQAAKYRCEVIPLGDDQLNTRKPSSLPRDDVAVAGHQRPQSDPLPRNRAIGASPLPIEIARRSPRASPGAPPSGPQPKNRGQAKARGKAKASPPSPVTPRSRATTVDRGAWDGRGPRCASGHHHAFVNYNVGVRGADAAETMSWALNAAYPNFGSSAFVGGGAVGYNQYSPIFSAPAGAASTARISADRASRFNLVARPDHSPLAAAVAAYQNALLQLLHASAYPGAAVENSHIALAAAQAVYLQALANTSPWSATSLDRRAALLADAARHQVLLTCAANQQNLMACGARQSLFANAWPPGQTGAADQTGLLTLPQTGSVDQYPRSAIFRPPPGLTQQANAPHAAKHAGGSTYERARGRTIRPRVRERGPGNGAAMVPAHWSQGLSAQELRQLGLQCI